MADGKGRKSLETLNKRYQQRITIAKHGQEAFRQGDFLNAIKYYNSYLKTLADIKEVSDKKLSPALFSQETELSEMLLISHVYWDLCKIYDRAPNLKGEFDRCLKQFSLFSVGLPYQVVNSEMLRRFIRAGKCLNKTEFQEAYKQVGVSSKKCYVATHCFGETDVRTNDLRLIKRELVKSDLGVKFVHLYYRYSTRLLTYLERHPKVDFLFTEMFAKPALYTLSKVSAFFLK